MIFQWNVKNIMGSSARGVIAKVLGCEFELLSRYYFHFWTNTLDKAIMGHIASLVFLLGWVWH